MENETKTKEKKYTPILPFDITTGEDFYMYDHPVYKRDITMFDHNEQMMNRGNVISILNYKMGEPRRIGGDPSAEEPEDAEKL